MNPLEHAALLSSTLLITLTPGPTTLTLAVAGERFGLRRTGPHLAGALLGYELQLLAGCVGLGQLVDRDPWLLPALQVISAAGLLWLGLRLPTLQGGRACGPRPMGLGEALRHQLLNAKSWLMAWASVGLFLPADGSPGLDSAPQMVAAGAAGLAGLCVWAWRGARLQRWLARPLRRDRYHRILTGLLALTALWALAG